MPGRISSDVLEAFLNCKFKGHLKLTGQSGVPTDYAVMQADIRQVLKTHVTEAIRAGHQPL
jgi:hypothetical protein